MWKKLLVGTATLVVVLVVAFAGFVWWMLQPREQNLSLPATLVAIDSPEGQEIAARATATADLAALKRAWESQELGSWCGVASGTIAVNALGGHVTQDDLLATDADGVKGFWGVTFGGMTLSELAAILRAHGFAAATHHAEDTDLEGFRSLLVDSLMRSSDVAIVNYHRTGVNQEGPGHLSPVGAYDELSDRFLILDTASYKYPWVWVNAETLYRAANTPDPASGRSRGYLLVGRGG